MNESEIATDDGKIATTPTTADTVSLPGAEPNIIEQPLTLRVLNNDIHHYWRDHCQHRMNEATKIEIQDNNKRVAPNLTNPIIKNGNHSHVNENSQLNNNNNNSNNNSNNNHTNNITNNLVNITTTTTSSSLSSSTLVNTINNKSELDKSKPYDCTTSNGHIVTEISSKTSFPLNPSSAPSNSLNDIKSKSENNIVDIASHLIETFNDSHDSDVNAAHIKELTPFAVELKSDSSKAETIDCIGQTIIEVEPADVINKKPIEYAIECPKSISLTEITDEIDEIDEVDNSQYSNLIDINYSTKNVAFNDSSQPTNNENDKKSLKPDAQLSIDINLIKNVHPLKEKSNTNTENLSEDSLDTKLSEQIDQQLSEVSYILESQQKNQRGRQQQSNGIVLNKLNVNNSTAALPTLKLIAVPSPKTIADEKERQLFIDSLPHINGIVDGTISHAQKIPLDSNREYYQSLKKYLIQSTSDRPPIPLKTYRWEDLRRAKEKGGYPWTHLYKHPLGPDEEPEIILMLRKSQEIHFNAESPKSIKKVRIDEQVTVKEAKCYLQELSEKRDDKKAVEETNGHLSEPHLPHITEDSENHSLQSESYSCVSDSILSTGKRSKKPQRFSEVRRLFRRKRYSARPNEDIQSLPDTHPIKDHILKKQNFEVIAQTDHSRNRPHFAKVSLYDTYKAGHCFPIMKKLKTMADRQKKRLKIKRISLGKNERITFNEETKILKLKSSPKFQRSDIAHFVEKQDSDDVLEIVQLEESPSRKHRDDVDDNNTVENNEKELKLEEIINGPKETIEAAVNGPPKKTPRLRRDHVYEEIHPPNDFPPIQQPQFNFILDATSVEALKQSLITQDRSALRELTPKSKIIPLDRMGSSEEEQINAVEQQQQMNNQSPEERLSAHHLAPMSSIDSTSSDEDRNRIHLPEVIEEESDQPEDDQHEQQSKQCTLIQHNGDILPLPSAIKKEPSPVPLEKKVTFSYVEDEAEPHREDIELSIENMAALKEANKAKTNATSDHEYEPIGSPLEKRSEKLGEIVATDKEAPEEESAPAKIDITEQKEKHLGACSSNNKKVLPEIDINISNESAVYRETVIQESMDKQEKKGFMVSAQNQTRKMQAGFKNQAGKLKTKLHPSGKKSPSSSPKSKDRKRFKAPQFSKIKIPDIKRPDMSKLRELKRPEFTKFHKIDMSKFKFPEKITSIKLKRSKSLKDNEEGEIRQDETTQISPKSETLTSQKKLFDFNFGTYPRALSRNKRSKAVEPESSFRTTTEATSTVPSTETQPSFESSNSPQGDRGPGPVRSRWADKFSDVSYNDSEGSRYRRFESEQGSFDRESSIDRRMRGDVEDTTSEDPTLTILGGVTDNKQFAEFDEENRAIHEISNLRSSEFRRRPIVHQDSDVRSDDSKEIIGWSDKDIEKNTLLLRNEIENDDIFMRRQPEDSITQETQSTTSSGKKLVLEEIDEDEFFLRKRGISQDNIELRQYISDAIREKYDKTKDQNIDLRSYRDYRDTPPPKPRRLYKADMVFQRNFIDDENENVPLSDQRIDESDFSIPKVPLRKLKGRRKYSTESAGAGDDESYQLPYFDNDEDYLRPPTVLQKLPYNTTNNITNSVNQRDDCMDMNEKSKLKPKPQPPKRQKRRREISLEKESFINGFGGRSVSNSCLQPLEDVIVYRTEHEYHHIPLATPDKYSDSLSIRKSLSNYDDYGDHTSQEAVSLEPKLIAGISDKYLVDLSESDGYAVVKKDHVPKPTPPARRKKFARLPGERFTTMPIMHTNNNMSPPERPPQPKTYTPSNNYLSSTAPHIMQNLDPQFNENNKVPVGAVDISLLRPESPRDLQSGDIINKMKYRPLPPPPRPPREKRYNADSSDMDHTTDTTEQQFDTSSQEPKEDYDIHRKAEEVEVSTQTDPLPDDFVCEEFEITNDMKVIVPRIYTTKTLDQLLQEEFNKEPGLIDQAIDSEQLAKGLQHFREANQRSLSERSQTSSQPEQRSKSLSRPQTPSAIVVEHEMLTSVPKGESLIQASLVVQPIDDYVLTLDEETIRHEMGLLSSSVPSNVSFTKDELLMAPSDISYAPSSTELNEAIELLTSDPDAQQTDEEVERTLQRYREELDEIGRQLMETTISQELASVHSTDDTKEISDREEIRSHEEFDVNTKQEYPSSSDAEILRSDDEIHEYERNISTITLTEPDQERTQNVLTIINEKELPQIPEPPPRKKSIPLEQLITKESALELLRNQDMTPVKPVVQKEKDITIDLPYRVSDLEVDRLRVHALQAGQIMVSQLQGSKIGSDELDCKSGNLIIKNIELPPGIIEDIVERVRQIERHQLNTSENQTQTSLESSPEKQFAKNYLRDIAIPPPKPPRLKDLDIKEPLSGTNVQNADEETQTDLILSPSSSLSVSIPTIYPSTEYLQSLAPLAFYNLHRATSGSGILEIPSPAEINKMQQRKSRPHKQSISDNENDDQQEYTTKDTLERITSTRQTKNSTPSTLTDDTQSVSQAGRKFITACSLSLINIINQLTDYVRGNKVNSVSQEIGSSPTDIRNRQVSALVVLFIVITFTVLIFLATGRNIHTHHWDFFNPPSHDGRHSS